MSVCIHIHTECLKWSHPCAKPRGRNGKSTVWFWIKEPESGEETGQDHVVDKQEEHWRKMSKDTTQLLIKQLPRSCEPLWQSAWECSQASDKCTLVLTPSNVTQTNIDTSLHLHFFSPNLPQPSYTVPFLATSSYTRDYEWLCWNKRKKACFGPYCFLGKPFRTEHKSHHTAYEVLPKRPSLPSKIHIIIPPPKFFSPQRTPPLVFTDHPSYIESLASHLHLPKYHPPFLKTNFHIWD